MGPHTCTRTGPCLSVSTRVRTLAHRYMCAQYCTQQVHTCTHVPHTKTDRYCTQMHTCPYLTNRYTGAHTTRTGTRITHFTLTPYTHPFTHGGQVLGQRKTRSLALGGGVQLNARGGTSGPGTVPSQSLEQQRRRELGQAAAPGAGGELDSVTQNVGKEAGQALRRPDRYSITMHYLRQFDTSGVKSHCFQATVAAQWVSGLITLD